MKQITFVLFFQLLSIFSVEAQVLKKIANGIKDGATGAFEFSKNTVSDAVEFGKIKNINKDIIELKFESAYEKLTEFKTKYPDNHVHEYFTYLIYNSEESKFKNYEIAYESIDNFVLNHFNLFDEKERVKLCKEIGLCEAKLLEQNKDIQYKLLISNKSTDSSITYFIKKYPKSFLIDSAKNIRYQLRYEKAKSINTFDSYTYFIRENPYSPQIRDARYNQSLLAFIKAESENTISAYQNFLYNYPGVKILDTKAKLKVKNLKMSEIYNGYAEIINKYGKLIKRFTFEFSKTDGSYNRDDGIVPISSMSSNYRLQSDKLASTEFTVESATINTSLLLDTFTKLIDDFNKDYPNSKELYFLNQIKTEILTIKERLDFYVLEKRSDDELFVNENALSSNPLEKFINAYPKSLYAIYAKNIKDKQINIFTKKQEQIRLRQAKEALAQAEIRKEQERKKEEESNPVYRVAKFLSPIDKKMLLDIIYGKITFNPDPKSIAGKKCGTGYAKCKWCDKDIYVDKVYKTKVGIISEIGGMGGLTLIFADDERIMQLAKEIKTYLQGIRNGNMYECWEVSGTFFCSLKCEYEYNDRRNRR